MGIPLFTYNQNAYLVAESMLETAGKAAIIHPTGTGKSFIGFKLAEEHAQSRFVWMAPSEYIYRTQVENLHAASPDSTVDNIQFLTYSKLLLLSNSEMLAYAPDYLILDEFHRCGAREWGSSLAQFLNLFPNVKILGLSATHVRYLDNQRDMAEELFEGHIASRMTLGEAIALGILEKPLYVTSVYAYQKQLTHYQERIDKQRGEGLQSENQKKLELLRRALEQADGLETIFRKYMKKNGKYILFCASREHMNEMLEHTSEWFDTMDHEPHIYQVYSEDSEADRAFGAFKEDDSNHLKLLYCIDMLNEGIHVDRIDGVILFRPTTSPIIYKQQIGRALSAGKGKQPVILDIVNNFESLYTISSIQEEIELAVSYYMEKGEGEKIVNTRFDIKDEVKECRHLFENLEKGLSAPWEIYFQAAKHYFYQYGDLNVPKRYQTEDGISLGHWIITQKRVRSGQTPGILTEAQIARLDAIGMEWENRLEASWERCYEAAVEYFQHHGNLDMRTDYVTEDGIKLGRWIVQMRQNKAGNIRAGLLNEERIERLEALGMIWDKFSFQWEQNYQQAAAYYLEHGNLEVPISYKTESGMALGHWIMGLRRKRKEDPDSISPEQVARLEAIGMRWSMVFEEKWLEGYRYAAAYYQEHGNLTVPATYTAQDGYKLGKWIYNQRLRQDQNKMPAEQTEKLNALGMEWKLKQPWDDQYELAKQYAEANGNLNVARNYVTDSGVWLGKWLYEQRKNKTTLTATQIERLESIGMDWRSPQERQFEEHLAAASRYLREHGNLEMPRQWTDESGFRLRRWLDTQLERYRNGKLDESQSQRVKELLQG